MKLIKGVCAVVSLFFVDLFNAWDEESREW